MNIYLVVLQSLVFSACNGATSISVPDMSNRSSWVITYSVGTSVACQSAASAAADKVYSSWINRPQVSAQSSLPPLTGPNGVSIGANGKVQ